MINRNDVLTILREYKRDNASKYGIIDLGLFGSVARQSAGENSDVDICIKTQTPDPFILVHIKEDLEQRVHTHIDIVRVREKMNSFLKARIEKEGVYV
jgi:predicted nucleotidyltransferase